MEREIDYKYKARRLEDMLSELFDWLDGAVLVARFILYVGSVAAAWFYLHDRVLAVGIVLSLTIAHLLIVARESIAERKRRLKESS